MYLTPQLYVSYVCSLLLNHVHTCREDVADSGTATGKQMQERRTSDVGWSDTRYDGR